MDDYFCPILKDIDYENKLEVCCPVCGDDYVHHETSTIILDGNDDYKADKSVRGNVIQIPMWCEGGRHRFSMKLGFHKGKTSMWFVYHGEKLI